MLTKVLYLFVIYVATVCPYGSSLYNNQPAPDKATALIYFSGSDWCADCIRLEKTAFSDSSFLSFLDQNGIVLKRVDFPQRKKLSKDEIARNNRMAEKYEFDGSFPTILLSRTDTLQYVKLTDLTQSADHLREEINSKLKQLQ